MISILLIFLREIKKQHLSSLILHGKVLQRRARTPGMGSLYVVDNLNLQGLRRWAVKGFKKYLIFYLESQDSITIVRLLYAAQDIQRILTQPDDED